MMRFSPERAKYDSPGQVRYERRPGLERKKKPVRVNALIKANISFRTELCGLQKSSYIIECSQFLTLSSKNASMVLASIIGLKNSMSSFDY